MTLLRSRTPTNEATLVAHPTVARALTDWEARVAAAREEGRRAGLAEAEARVRHADQVADAKQQKRQQEFAARFDAPLAALLAAVQRLDPLEKRLVAESEAECVRLALALAATILRRELEMDPAWMDALVKRALAEIPDRRAITIRLHPTDADVLSGRVREVRDAVPGLEQLQIIGDADVARGTCVLASRGTRVDTSLAGCWERLATQLLDVAPSAEVTEIAPPPAGLVTP